MRDVQQGYGLGYVHCQNCCHGVFEVQSTVYVCSLPQSRFRSGLHVH